MPDDSRYSRKKCAELSQLDIQNTSYQDKNSSFISVTPKAKKHLDLSSELFYTPTAKYSPRILDEMYHSNTQWYQTIVKSCRVNEDAQFDRDYSKKRKQQENSSSLSPCSKQMNQISNKERIHDENEQIKKQNHNFSDLFGRECGYKSKDKKLIYRSISPSMPWHTFDSVRNAKDCLNNTQITNKQEQDTDDVKYQSKSKEGEKGLFVSPKKSGQKKRNEKPGTQQKKEVQYQGIYRWKNNYKK